MEKMHIKPILPNQELEKFRQEQLQLLQSDISFYQRLTELGIHEAQILNDIALFMDYHDDVRYCEKCPGFSSCQKERPYTQIYLAIEDGKIERKTCFCPYMKERRMLEKQFIVHDFPEEWFGVRKGDVDVSQSRRELLQFLLAVLKEEVEKKWLYLQGNSRMGKSYILSIFCQELIKKNPQWTCAFLDMPTRCKEWNDLIFQDKALLQEKINAYMEADILVLDDFGSEYQSDYIRDIVLAPLMQTRMKNNKITFISSRYSTKEIVELHGKTTAGKIKMKKMMETISDFAKKIKLLGVSVY